MSKFLKRIGTKAYKFHVDIYLKRFEINVVSPSKAETCSCLVIFKRGEHTIKAKAQVPLANKEALFSEVISHISTLYYSKKSKKFLPKPASLDVMLIFREKEHKFAGTAAFDLATFPNSGVKKSLQIVNLEKCPDKDAKLSFEIRIKKLGEVENPENDTSFIQANQTLKSKKSQKNEKTAKTTQNPQKTPENLDKSEKNEKVLKKSQTNVTNTSVSRLETAGTSTKLANTNKKPVSSENLPKKLLQPPNKPNNIPKNNRNESVSSNSSSDSSSGVSGSSSSSGSGSGSDGKSSSPSENSLSNGGNSTKRPAVIKKAEQNKPVSNENAGKTSKTLNNLNVFCNNNANNLNELDLSNAKSTHTVNSDDHLSQQIKALLKDSAHGSKESAKLDVFLRKDERILKKPSKGSEEDEDEQLFAEFSAQKIKQLEQKLSAKLKENSENLEKIRVLQGENIQLREELCAAKQELSETRAKNSRISLGTPTFEAQICEKDNEVKTLRLENLELRNTIRLKDLEIKEKSVNFRPNPNNEIEKLKEMLENKEKALEEAEAQLIASKAGLETLKSARNSNSKEEFFKKKLETANQEIFLLKNQLEEERNSFEMQKFELEQEKQRLLLENQRLSQQKTIAAGAGEREKSSCSKLERENAELQGKLQAFLKENAENREKMLVLEQEIQRTKTKLGEVLNVALEMGGVELVELLEAAIIDTRLSMK